MIPEGQYDRTRLDRLARHLVVQLRNAQSSRSQLEEKWKMYERAYRTKPMFEKKDFPFEGCSNLVVPLIATDVDKVYAWIMAMLFGQDNLWSVSAWRPDWMDFASKAQEFLEWSQSNELNIYPEIADWVKELCLLGTSVLKTRYDRQVEKVYEYREQQTTNGQQGQVFERQARVMMKDQPKVEHLSVWDFYLDPAATKVEDAAWCAHHIPMSWAEFEDRVAMGIYQKDGRITEGWATFRGHDLTKQRQELDGYTPFEGTDLELYEFWVKADIDGDGQREALVVTIHVPSGTVVRYDFNPYFNQQPPFDICRFVRIPKALYGVGLGEMLYYGEQEVTTMHNQRIDAVTVRNMPVFWYLKGGSFGQHTPIFPGAKIPVDSPNQFGALPLAVGQFVSTAPDEQMAMGLMRERVGVNDFVTGGDGPDVSYASATTALNQVREGKKRFDQTMREVRYALSGVGMKVLELYQQFNQRGKQFTALGSKDGEIVTQVLNFPLDIIRAGVIVDVAATSASLNKEVEVRTNTLLMQLLSEHNQQQLQLMTQMLNPQVPPQIQQMIMGQLRSGSMMMKKILDSYGVQDASDLITDFSGGVPGGNSGQGGFGGGQGAPPGLGAPPGMGALPAGAPLPPQGPAQGAPVGGFGPGA